MFVGPEKITARNKTLNVLDYALCYWNVLKLLDVINRRGAKEMQHAERGGELSALGMTMWKKACDHLDVFNSSYFDRELVFSIVNGMMVACRQWQLLIPRQLQSR